MAAGIERREYRIARSRTQHGLLLSVVLAIIGLAIIAFGGSSIADAELVGALNLVVALLILVIVWRRTRDPQPHLVLDERGVDYRDWGLGPVPWQHIDQASIDGSRVNSYLAIRLTDADRFAAGLEERQRRKLRVNRLIRPPELRIPQGALDAPLEDICTAVTEGIRRAHPDNPQGPCGPR